MKKFRKFISWLKPKPRKIVCGCGHVSPLKKKISINEHAITLKIRYREGVTIPYCLDCIEKMSIVCPWCGKPILVGDYVTLYTPTDPNYEIPKSAIVYSRDPLRLVGCQRPGCAYSGADYCGTWEAPGFVKRFPSAIERVMKTGEPVIMNF